MNKLVFRAYIPFSDSMYRSNKLMKKNDHNIIGIKSQAKYQYIEQYIYTVFERICEMPQSVRKWRKERGGMDENQEIKMCLYSMFLFYIH